MIKRIILKFKFYMGLDFWGERKMTQEEKFEMHFVHFLFSCFPTIVLGTIIFTTSPKSFEYKLYFTIGIFIFFIFYFYFVAFMSRYLAYHSINK